MVSSEKISKAILLLLKKESGGNELVSKLIKFLEKNHLTLLLPKIVNKIERKLEAEEKANTLVISSAFDLNEDTLDQIKKKINLDFNNQTKKQFRIEEDLLGGVVLRYKHFLFDLSLKKNLEYLKETLLQK
jgi:F-type H+-transporting ATPase subunit delta